ncbi:aa3-type cytochrome c oxidase subunit IV [Sphingomonas flavalba]|nr:aa3-type cytochrome c oxidase subunit IV [Sphingomonas flavalba]
MATNDFDAHEQTYSGFTSLIKYSAIISFVTTMIIIMLIAR